MPNQSPYVLFPEPRYESYQTYHERDRWGYSLGTSRRIPAGKRLPVEFPCHYCQRADAPTTHTALVGVYVCFDCWEQAGILTSPYNKSYAQETRRRERYGSPALGKLPDDVRTRWEQAYHERVALKRSKRRIVTGTGKIPHCRY